MSYYDEICSRERFAKDTAEHKIQVIRDDGVYRHLRFKKPDSSAYYFDLVTWPGYLAITGDMGGNLFSRVNDMFSFFRTDFRRGDCTINPSYWHEKLVCQGERDGATEFDEAAFRRVIGGYRIRWMRDMKMDGKSKDDRCELWDAVENDVLAELDDGQTDAAMIAASRFKHGGYSFNDLFYYNFKKFTLHYIWRCRAIVWGIEQYDALKSEQEGGAA
ncbi:hypothetical protein A9J41_12645 [Laribacter hongkongensis]|uniref:hypothetical protein n=1 Tax=Laribacter hongkongensis TaxID=168471 RepID=UPI0018779B9C|nr:hypothetical protein [Laribacter hongkongensis]MBE5528356.1 hypothetical protein [Laribacter hongkongensis]